ncbi:MAG TPA: secondary thiamine-phosphate synthase enzyme YjbQ [Candidatus Saccharimonadales bacterium]|nr:secondary thiamine-phosphate synthase enzyme YjbQ [Candidatus Saccharimonadales bacterium]
MELSVKTQQNHEVIDITDRVQELVASSAKAVCVFTSHTTCAVTTADLDPGAGEDLASAVWEMAPKLEYDRHHNPSHFPAHVAASVIGPSVIVPVKNAHLVLGSWQRIVLIELDGPRSRQLSVINLE